MPDTRPISILGGISGFAVVALSVMTLSWACTAKSETSQPVPTDKAIGGQQASVPTDPATAEQLEPVFPEIPGWTRGPVISANGANEPSPAPGISTTPVSYSGVQTTYTSSQVYVEASLVDSVDMVGLFSRQLEADRGHQIIPVAHQRYPSWTNRYGSQFHVMIKRRFVLMLWTGTAHNDLAALTALAQKLDLGRLDRLN